MNKLGMGDLSNNGQKKIMTVEADPLFGPTFGHEAWGFDCPYCGDYYETVCTTDMDDKIECDSCGEFYLVKYPGQDEE